MLLILKTHNSAVGDTHAHPLAGVGRIGVAVRILTKSGTQEPSRIRERVDLVYLTADENHPLPLIEEFNANIEPDAELRHSEIRINRGRGVHHQIACASADREEMQTVRGTVAESSSMLNL